MLLQEIYKILDTYVPKKLSDDFVATYGGHDNSGILVDTGTHINKVLFSLDLTEWAIEKAKKIGANLIVAHHPAIFYPVSNITMGNSLGKKLIKCIENGISVIAMHLNADCVMNGVDYYLAKAVGATDEENIPKQKINNGGYGRVFSVKEILVEEMAQRIKDTLGANNVWIFGENKKINKVATFCGAGIDGASLSIAKENGANLLISADIKHNYVLEAVESGISVIQLTHYASENYGFKKIYQNLKDKLGVDSEYHDDSFML